MNIQTQGKLVADRKGIRLQFSYDLCNLWNWFILKETGKKLSTPLRSSKIGLHRFKYRPHPSNPNSVALKKLIGKKFEVNFDIKNIVIVYSKRKGYWVSFINVNDPVVWGIIEELNLNDNFSPKKSIDMSEQWKYNLPHMSISNGKYMKEIKVSKDQKWFWNNQFTQYK